MGIDIATFVAGDEGRAELSDETIKLTQGDNQILGQPLLSPHETCKRFMFLELPVGWSKEFVYTDRRQVCVCLSGQLRFETSDGSVASLSSGDVWRYRDKDTMGLTSKVVGEDPVTCLLVQLD